MPGEEGGYSSIARHPENRKVPGLTIFRFDCPLFFADEIPMRDMVRSLLKSDPVPGMIVLDMQLCPDLDISSMDMMLKLVDKAAAAGIAVVFAEVISAVRDAFRRSGMLEKIGEDHVFLTVNEAVKLFQEGKGKANPEEPVSP